MLATGGALRRSAPVFAALGDETRLRLVTRLCADGPQSISRLTEGAAITRQAVTKHLLVLEDAGIVQVSRMGRESRWALAPGRIEAARSWLDMISEQWSRRLHALERHLASMPGSDGPSKRRKR